MAFAACPLQLFLRERAPALVHDPGGRGVELCGIALEVLRPEPKSHPASQLWVERNDVQLEERVLVEVRGAKRQPPVVTDVAESSAMARDDEPLEALTQRLVD